MVVFRVFKDDVREGYWFKYGGELREDCPPEPMEIIPRNINYVSCTDNPYDDLKYFPKERIEKLGGKYGIFEVDKEHTEEYSDCIGTYLSFDYRQGKLLHLLSYDEFIKWVEEEWEK
jgi:hypothetical protein